MGSIEAACAGRNMIELAIVLLLILLNGVFALSELAVVSARPARLKSLAKAGQRGARQAQILAADPGRFLSTVQVGMTLIGILIGAYSAAAFDEGATKFFMELGVPASAAAVLGVGLVVILTTYLSVVIGELVPKNLALRNAEPFACMVAPLMSLLSRLARPAVWLLDSSTELIFKLLGGTTETRKAVTDEEIKTVMAAATSAGALEAGEHRLISGVLRLPDRPARALMTRRAEVDWLDLSASEEAIRRRLMTTPHSLLPAGRGSSDRVVGVVQTQELLAELLSGKPLDLEAALREAAAVPENVDALDVLESLRWADIPMVLVHDEHGQFEGVVTPADILEAVAGAFKSDIGGDEPLAMQREDGSWLLSGSMLVDEMSERLGVAVPLRRDYQTVAGFVLAQLHHIPMLGEHVDTGGWRFEVIDVDGRRIDKVLATSLSDVTKSHRSDGPTTSRN
jgi:putative hemolysin